MDWQPFRCQTAIAGSAQTRGHMILEILHLPRADARHTTSLEDLRHLIVEYRHVCASLGVVVPRAGSVSEMRQISRSLYME